MTLNQIVYILTTAIAVSLDSFFAGFAVGYKSTKSFTLPLSASLLTLVTCLVISLPTMFVKQYINESTLNQIGACILLSVGLFNLISQEKDCSAIKQQNSLKQCIAIGFAVALDASVACASLTVMDYPPLTVAIIFAIMHLVTVFLGQQLARAPKLSGFLRKFDWLGGVMLIALAFVKCL